VFAPNHTLRRAVTAMAIGLLAESFANRAAHEMGRRVNGLSTDVYQVLRSYHWPGNVRELQNVVRRAIAMTTESVAGVDDLPDDVVASAGRSAGAEAGAVGYFAQRAEYVARFEKQYLGDLLARHLGDVSAAAREARLPRGTLYRLMKGHGLDGAAFRRARNTFCHRCSIRIGFSPSRSSHIDCTSANVRRRLSAPSFFVKGVVWVWTFFIINYPISLTTPVLVPNLSASMPI
ncbi:MAG: helix-turn-helix domain-containing protein, partial [Planctomycetota bacterium]